MQLAADQRRNRAELAAQRDQANKVLAELKIEKAKVDGDRKVAEADLGPVRYLATLLGAGDQDVLRWFILVIALLLDPAAVLLLLAATRR
jgi:phage antirepressor YoqD-like protein